MKRYRASPFTSFPFACVVSSLSIFPTRVVHVWQLMHHNHLKSTVCIRVHSWCCTFCGFGWMCNVMYPSFYYPSKNLHHSKNSLCQRILLHPSLLTPGNNWSFYYLHSFSFSTYLFCKYFLPVYGLLMLSFPWYWLPQSRKPDDSSWGAGYCGGW